jgi:uncharacterized protein YutE (UPF0331/DUF86 family)
MNSDRIYIKLAELEKYIEEVKEILPNSENDYVQSVLYRRALERTLQIGIESIIDICAILVQILHLGPPSDEDSILDLLEGKLQSIKIIKDMKRFRNILVHKYGIVDDHKVFSIASESIGDFDSIINEIKDLIQTIENIDVNLK